MLGGPVALHITLSTVKMSENTGNTCFKQGGKVKRNFSREDTTNIILGYFTNLNLFATVLRK